MGRLVGLVVAAGLLAATLVSGAAAVKGPPSTKHPPTHTARLTGEPLGRSGQYSGGNFGFHITECPQAKLPPNIPRALDRRDKDALEAISERGDDKRANYDQACVPENETSIAINPQRPTQSRRRGERLPGRLQRLLRHADAGADLVRLGEPEPVQPVRLQPDPERPGVRLRPGRHRLQPGDRLRVRRLERRLRLALDERRLHLEPAVRPDRHDRRTRATRPRLRRPGQPGAAGRRRDHVQPGPDPASSTATRRSTTRTGWRRGRGRRASRPCASRR